MTESDYVQWEHLHTLSNAELREVIAEGGPAAVVDACRGILADREYEADRPDNDDDWSQT